MIDVSCASCGQLLLHYQKDGPGWLKRCYLNRIFGPEKWAALQKDINIVSTKDMPDLVCDCGEIIGTPMLNSDGRLAFRLGLGKFKRKLSKDK